MRFHRHRWNRVAAWSLLMVCLLLVGTAVAASLPRPVTVVMDDGRRLHGLLVEADEQRVVLEVAGIRTPVAREAIEQINDRPSPEAYHRQQRAELADDDVLGRVELALELSDLRAHELALKELADLVEREPGNASLARIKRTVEARQQLEQQPPGTRRRPAAGNASPPAPAAPGAATADRPAHKPADRLTQEQINRIRVYEVDLADQPRVRVPRETIDKLLTRYADHPRVPRSRSAQARLRRAPGFQQLALLFEVRARDLYGEVEVRNEPPPLRSFRTQIHQRYVLNYCATNECHGGDHGAGGLQLINTHGNTDATVYTNFLRLHQYANNDGRMIDRRTPERSLLLQYGLARNSAVEPHPDTPGWRPHFRDAEDTRFQNDARIIGSLYKPTPDYGIDHTPAARPATDDTGENTAAPTPPPALEPDADPADDTDTEADTEAEADR